MRKMFPCRDVTMSECLFQALAINADDSWATHALAHVYADAARPKEGIAFMKQTENDWKVHAALR